MFLKKDESRYMYGCVHPEELAGVKKNPLSCLMQAEKYGLNIWMEYINIPNLP